MKYEERIQAYLRSIAPDGATNGEIARQLNIRWHASVYRATQCLMDKGSLRGEREGREWTFFAEEIKQAQFQPVEAYSLEINRAKRSWQTRWLVPLLERPEGRAWFLDRLRCPCSPAEARAADVSHFCLPLRDLFEEDYLRCRGHQENEERFVAYFNDLFGLPEDCGIMQVWRTARKGRMRLPVAAGKAGWSDKLLSKQIAHTRFRRRARHARTLLQTECDVMLLMDDHVLLAMCVHRGSLPHKEYALYRRLAGSLELRLGKSFRLGAVVDEAKQLGALEVARVCWREIAAWLGDSTPNGQETSRQYVRGPPHS